MAQQTHPTVVVAALTFRRNEMLRQLLSSFRILEMPKGWGVRFLIVDNDPKGSARPVVDEFETAFGEALTYVVEKEPGIPFARNRALDEATKAGARLLCFIDDDEYPAPDWLLQLVMHFEQTGAVLIGGPTRLQMPSRSLEIWQRFFAKSLLARSDILEWRAARNGRVDKIDMIATNNWATDVIWVGKMAIRFDETLRFSGGSDGRFFFEVLENNGQVAWCERAVVYEQIEPQRLRFRYYLSRAFAQGMVRTRIRRERTARLLIIQSARIVFGAALVVMPLYGIASFAIGTRMIAGGLGRLAGLRGNASFLYARDMPGPGSDAA